MVRGAWQLLDSSCCVYIILLSLLLHTASKTLEESGNPGKPRVLSPLRPQLGCSRKPRQTGNVFSGLAVLQHLLLVLDVHPRDAGYSCMIVLSLFEFS